MPRIEINNYYAPVSGPAFELESEKDPMNVSRLAPVARVNTGLSIVNTPLNTTKGVNNHGISDDAPIIDLTGNDPLLSGGVHRSTKQDLVNGCNDGSNNEDDGIPHIGHQRDGDDSSNGNYDDEDKEYSGPDVATEPLRQGKRVRRQDWYLIPSHKGTYYDQGVAFHQVSHLTMSKG
jgi:hypothetical protein